MMHVPLQTNFNAWVRRPAIPQPQQKLLVDLNQWQCVWNAHRELIQTCIEKDKFLDHHKKETQKAKGQTTRALQVNKKLQEENWWATQLLASLRETVGDSAWRIAVDQHMVKHGLLQTDCDIQRTVLAPRAASPKPIRALLPKDAVIRAPVARKPTLNDMVEGRPSSFEWINDIGFDQPNEFPPVEVTEELTI